MNKKFIFSNIFGSFVFNSKYIVIDKGKEEKLRNKYKNLFKPEGSELKNILDHFKKKTFFNDFHSKNIITTKQKLKEILIFIP